MILTSEKILDIHKLIISNFGGIDGVLCQGTIDYLVDQINAESDLFRKRQSLCISSLIATRFWMETRDPPFKLPN